MNASISSNYYRPGKNDFLRLSVFCLFSIFVHAAIINSIKLPTKRPIDKIIKPVQLKINKPVPPANIPKTTRKTPTKETVKQKVKTIQREIPPHSTKQEKQVNAPVAPKIQKTDIEIENPSKAFNAIQLRNESLNSISEMNLEEEIADDMFEVFDPVLQQKINKARHEKNLLQKLHPDKLDLGVDDINPEYGGYREAIVNGRCWLIPEDISFDPLNSRIVMLNPNCDEPKNILSDLIKSLKQHQ